MPELKFITENHPLKNINGTLFAKLADAQAQVFERCFDTGFSLIDFVSGQLHLSIKGYESLKDKSAAEFANQSFFHLKEYYKTLLQQNGIPEQAIRLHSNNLAARTHLVRAFDNPEFAINNVKEKVVGIISTFPRNGKDIECGRNKGDILDPFILAANQYLLHSGDFDAAVGSTVAHKALMIVEGLLGHLHEDVLGFMRGNVRVPEPRGLDQEKFDYLDNPFPGADVIQPPFFDGDSLKIHQIKSKTGSAKGGDGRRLGEQLNFLSNNYSAKAFYHALVGNTLVGHRSKTGVEKAAPDVVVVVGAASFRILTNSEVGAELLLKLYQEAFIAASEETKYSIVEVSETIATYFREESQKYGDEYLQTILKKATEGEPTYQDSRLFNKRKK